MRRALSFLIWALVPVLASAQVNKAWVQRWSGPDNYGLGRGLAVDSSRNVYVTGSTTISGSFAGVTLKYAPDGQLLWHKYFSGTPRGAVADHSGNVYVIGTMFSGSTPVMWIVKYLPDGYEDWSRTYGSAGASDIALDGSGNVYVSGWSRSGPPTVYRLITVKYSPSGDVLWSVAEVAERYIENVPIAVGDASVYVCAPVQGVTYLAAYGLDGTRRWYKRYGTFSAYTPGYWGDVGVDNAGNAYFASCKPRDATPALADCVVGAYSSDGGLLWEDVWACAAQGISTGGALAVDRSSGNVFVTGLYYPDYQVNVKRSMTMKYSSTGARAWVQTFVGEGDWDCGYDITLDRHGNAYVAGFTDEADSGSVCLLMKYSPGGEQKWVEKYFVEPGDDVWTDVAVDRSDNVYVGGNVTTTWTPYTILLTAGKYSQKGKFKPDRDGWQFSNITDNMWPETWWSQFDYTKAPYPVYMTWPPINATAADFPDWPLYVDVYGSEQCYKKSPDGLTYFSPEAVLNWRCMVGRTKVRDSTGTILDHWKGSCAGFTLAALLCYNDLLLLPSSLGDHDSVYSVPLSDDSRYLVNKFYITYLGNLKPTYALPSSQAFSALKAMLVDTYTNDQWVGIFDAVTLAGHAVVGCSMKDIGSGWWELPIYDPNYPGTYMHLNYSVMAEEWAAEEAGWNNLNICVRPIRNFSQTPVFPVAASVAATSGPASDSYVSVFNSPYSGIRIRNAAGEAIGFGSGAVIDSMVGAEPQVDFSGGGTPPGGYFLPPGDYTASIGASVDSTTYFAMFLDHAALSFHRQGATAADNELLRFSTESKSLSVTNPDLRSKSLVLQSIENSSGEETVCRLHVQAMPPADSLGVRLPGDRTVALFVGSTAMEADLWLELAKDFANPVFEYAGLVLEGGASYVVAPVWDSLAVAPVQIMVDRDRDGTVDDTLRLNNQATGVQQRGLGQVPDRFKLHQNYPNPFNPSTTIKYELPKSSMVRLSVYDILGRELSVLVNERKNAGSYEVKFDATGLPSGVYLYRLQADDTVQTRKLLLLR